jgi:pimeloyl-ACP methyl ester carboxylesterase
MDTEIEILSRTRTRPRKRSFRGLSLRLLVVFVTVAYLNTRINAFVVPVLRRNLWTITPSYTQHNYQRGVDTGGTAIDTTSTTTTVQNYSTRVRRCYETFCWKRDGEEYKINYRREGAEKDPPILLIHGFGANIGHFRHQFHDLVRAGYRVYAIDLLGFGASDKPGHVDYSIQLFGDLLQDFIFEMDSEVAHAKKWVVAGNSMGGLSSLEVGSRLMDRIRGIALFNCAPGMSVFRYADFPSFARPMLSFFQKVVLGPFLGSFFFSNFRTRKNVEAILTIAGVYRDTTNVDDELMESLLEPGNDVGSETVFLKVFGGDPGPTPESILPSLECPVLGIWGGADPWLSPDRGMHPATEFHRYMKDPKDFRLHILPNVGHCPQDEVPGQVNEILITWLESLTLGRNEQEQELGDAPDSR